MEKADKQGGVTAHEIAEALDARELPVAYETSTKIGSE
jgi:hypothetical protein